MATEFDKMLFDQHLEEMLALPGASRWDLERDTQVPLEVFCTMFPRTALHERYKVRLRWTDYSTPPSVKYVDPQTGADNDARAWPNFDGSRPGSFFLCAPFTKEGHDHHPEWRGASATRYEAPEDPLVSCLLQLQHLLDNSYVGRGHP